MALAPPSAFDAPAAISACRRGDPDSLAPALGPHAPGAPSALFDAAGSHLLLPLAIQSRSVECVALLLRAGVPLHADNTDRLLLLADNASAPACGSLIRSFLEQRELNHSVPHSVPQISASKRRAVRRP